MILIRLAGLFRTEGSKVLPLTTSFIVLFEKTKTKKVKLRQLNEGFSLYFNLILLINVILCNLGLIHAVHFYLNGLFILLPLVQQCCYIFFFYISSIIISPLKLLQWM